MALISFTLTFSPPPNLLKHSKTFVQLRGGYTHHFLHLRYFLQTRFAQPVRLDLGTPSLAGFVSGAEVHNSWVTTLLQPSYRENYERNYLHEICLSFDCINGIVIGCYHFWCQNFTIKSLLAHFFTPVAFLPRWYQQMKYRSVSLYGHWLVLYKKYCNRRWRLFKCCRYQHHSIAIILWDLRGSV